MVRSDGGLFAGGGGFQMERFLVHGAQRLDALPRPTRPPETDHDREAFAERPYHAGFSMTNRGSDA